MCDARKMCYETRTCEELEIPTCQSISEDGPERESKMDTINWGIIGAGHISTDWIGALREANDGQMPLAIASRDEERAKQFASKLSLDRFYSSYESLLSDPDIDAIYVGNTHNLHFQAAYDALEANKHVVVTKPLVLNASQAETLGQLAEANKRFFMEGLWSRFTPSIRRLREVLGSGALGEIQFVRADYSHIFPRQRIRLFDPALGGGALMDIGIYCFAFASLALGSPDRVVAFGNVKDGVDEVISAILFYPNGAHAQVFTSMKTFGPNVAHIAGTDGSISFDFVPETTGWSDDAPWTYIDTKGNTIERCDDPRDRGKRIHQAVEVGRCLRAGLLESPLMPIKESISILKTVDDVRQQIGLTFPGEHMAELELLLVTIWQPGRRLAAVRRYGRRLGAGRSGVHDAFGHVIASACHYCFMATSSAPPNSHVPFPPGVLFAPVPDPGGRPLGYRQPSAVRPDASRVIRGGLLDTLGQYADFPHEMSHYGAGRADSP
jgi:predicted dehydrogenase